MNDLFFLKKTKETKKRKNNKNNKKGMDEKQEKRKPGRPRGARNKNPLKQRVVVLGPNSYEARQQTSTQQHHLTSATGLGTFLQLEALLTSNLKTYWTDEKVLAHFGTDAQSDVMEDMCHFYSSSKGRLIVDDGSLQKCGLFPGIELSSDFLSRYLHNYTDVSNYGALVAHTIQTLRQRARALSKQGKK